MKQITFYANENEQRDFERVRAALERNSDAVTVRAMLSLCKKFLIKNIDKSNIGECVPPPNYPISPAPKENHPDE